MLTVKALLQFLESIDYDAPIEVEADGGKQLDVVNVYLHRDIDNDGYVRIKVTERHGN